MTGSMQLIREFCDQLIEPEKVTRTRIVSTRIFCPLLKAKRAYEAFTQKTTYTIQKSCHEIFSFFRRQMKSSLQENQHSKELP